MMQPTRVAKLGREEWRAGPTGFVNRQRVTDLSCHDPSSPRAGCFSGVLLPGNSPPCTSVCGWPGARDVLLQVGVGAGGDRVGIAERGEERLVEAARRRSGGEVRLARGVVGRVMCSSIGNCRAPAL